MNRTLEKARERLKISESFKRAEKGTRSEVYLSQNFVIKINKNIPLLKHEASVLRSLNSNIVPEIVDFFVVDSQDFSGKKIAGSIHRRDLEDFKE